MRIYPSYTDNFKADAIALLERTDRTLPQVAEALGVAAVTLRDWYKKSQMGTKKKTRIGRGLAAKSAKVAAEAPASLEEENEQLRRELKQAEKRIADLEMDRAILKKAAAFFAKESE